MKPKNEEEGAEEAVRIRGMLRQAVHVGVADVQLPSGRVFRAVSRAGAAALVPYGRWAFRQHRRVRAPAVALALVVVVDAEADPDYALDGLGNLCARRAPTSTPNRVRGTRRARPVERVERRKKLHFLKYVGTLGELRCAKHGERRNARAGVSAPLQPEGLGPRQEGSRPHAAVAFVRYGATESTGVLVYIKRRSLVRSPLIS